MRNKGCWECRSRTVGVLLAVLAAVLLWPSVAAASPESYELLRSGAEDLTNRRYAAALQKFEAAAQADPNDTEAWFFQGVALNRLGRFPEALARLQEARDKGVQLPDLAFETGWSLLGLRRWQEAATQLEQFEREHPGRGQTSEFLGRAALGMNELDKAEEHFAEALRRDPSLEPTVQLQRGVLARRRGDPQAARESFEALLLAPPRSATGYALWNQMAGLVLLGRTDTRRPDPRDPLSFTASLSGGYNSNVIALGEGVPLPVDISNESSLYARLTLGARYARILDSGDNFSAGYAFRGDVYEAVHAADLMDHFLYADYGHNFSPRLAGSVRISDQFTFIGGSKFRNQIAVRPALFFRHSPRATTELAYSLAASNYYFAAPAVQNRDGTTHSLAATHYFQPNRRWQARLGAFYTRNNADGADFDFHSYGVLAGVTTALGRQTLEATYSRSFDRYRNPNSFTGFTTRRDDNVDVLALQVSRPVRENWSVYGRYEYVRDHSNIAVFNYKQHNVSAGVIAYF